MICDMIPTTGIFVSKSSAAFQMTVTCPKSGPSQQANALLSAHNAEVLENTASMQLMHSSTNPLNEREADESQFAQQWTEAKCAGPSEFQSKAAKI